MEQTTGTNSKYCTIRLAGFFNNIKYIFHVIPAHNYLLHFPECYR